MKAAQLIGFDDKRLPLAIPAPSLDKGWAGTRVNSPGPVECIAIIRDLPANASRVMRIGAFPIYRKKLPRNKTACRVHSGKGRVPQRAGQSRPRPEGAHPSLSLPDAGEFPGAGMATRSNQASHPIKWSWHLNCPPPVWLAATKVGIAGEVIEQGRKRSGAGREALGISYAPRISGKRCYV